MATFAWRSEGALTCGLLGEHDFGLGREVLSRENHLLAAVHQAAVGVLSLHHGQLVGGPLGCGREKTRCDDGRHPLGTVPRSHGARGTLPASVTANAEPSPRQPVTLQTLCSCQRARSLWG